MNRFFLSYLALFCYIPNTLQDHPHLLRFPRLQVCRLFHFFSDGILFLIINSSNFVKSNLVMPLLFRFLSIPIIKTCIFFVERHNRLHKQVAAKLHNLTNSFSFLFLLVQSFHQPFLKKEYLAHFQK